MRVGDGLPEHERLLHLVLWGLALGSAGWLRVLTPSLSSARHWSKPLIATKKRSAFTFSKQWIHFFRSDLWPPTSNMRYCRAPKSKCVSVIPVVRNRARKTSWLLGRKSRLNSRSRSMKKLQKGSACESVQGRGGRTSSGCPGGRIHSPSQPPVGHHHPSTCP